MKYLKRWIENTLPNVEKEVSDSGSCYYDIDGCLSIRVSNHFTPLPKSRCNIEIVQSLNNEEFAVRYKKSLSFFLYDRSQLKEVIRTNYDMCKSDFMVTQSAEEIVANREKKLIEKYKNLLSLTRIFLTNKRYDNIITAKNDVAMMKALNKCEFFMALSEEIKNIIRKAYKSGIIKQLFLDLIIRAYMSKNNITEVNKIINEMVNYNRIILRDRKRSEAEVKASKINEEIKG